MKKSIYLKETTSTNTALWEAACTSSLPEGTVLYTDYQTAGKGQTGNSWFSDRGKNLLMSIVLYPSRIELSEHFILSQIISIAIKKTLDEYTDNISIKWPNDIYWKDRKIVGILIENSLKGAAISQSVAGIGVNVNQKHFPANLPNPVSLYQITGKRFARKAIMQSVQKNILDIYRQWGTSQIRKTYMQMLFRKEGYHTFKNEEETFEAKIVDVQPDGRLDLEEKNGKVHGYYMKEVEFVL